MGLIKTKFLSLVILILIPLFHLFAQDIYYENNDLRIRVKAPFTVDASGTRRMVFITGTPIRISVDTLVIHSDNKINPVYLPLASIKKLEISLGKNPAVHSKVLTGAAVGILAGGLILVAHNEREFNDLAPRDAFLLGGAFGVIPGALIGLAFSTSDRWKKVSFEEFRNLKPGENR